VANSNTEQAITPGFTAVLVCQGVAEVKAGDTIDCAFAVSKEDEGLGLIATKPGGEPVVPSVIFSAFKADGSAYAQLSSTDSQMAGSTGKLITLNQTDSSKDVENSAGVVRVKNAGVYFVITTGQVGSAEFEWLPAPPCAGHKD
jgi:hypothetical protein